MSGAIGLLVVHGIGRQAPGQTLDGLLAGLRLAYGERLRVERADPTHARLDGLGRTVHALEVHWAGHLHGQMVEETFAVQRVHETVWLPLEHQKAGMLPARLYPRGRLVLTTWLLALIGVLAATGLMGASFVVAAVQGAREAAREAATRQVSKRKRRTVLDDVLDQVAADVFNYVDGVADAFRDGVPHREALKARVAGIRSTFLATASRAADLGCRELQVLAHSLGTVVAFHGMCAEGAIAAGPPTMQLTRLYTIGSPLEKFRLFWTPLTAVSVNGPVVGTAATRLADASAQPMRWDNFYSALDLVSGPLRPFEGWPAPTNRPARGLGGLISAHVAYHANPSFLECLGEGLFGSMPVMQVPLAQRLWGRARAAAESLTLPVVVFLLSSLGLGVMVGFAAGVGWLIAWPIDWLGLPRVAMVVRYYIPASIFFLMTVGAIIIGRDHAREHHARYWSRP